MRCFSIWRNVAFCRWLWNVGFQVVRQNYSSVFDKKYFSLFLSLRLSQLWGSGCFEFIWKQDFFRFTCPYFCNHYSKSAILNARYKQCCGYWKQKKMGNAARAIRNYYVSAHCTCRSCAELPFIESNSKQKYVM